MGYVTVARVGSDHGGQDMQDILIEGTAKLVDDKLDASEYRCL